MNRQMTIWDFPERPGVAQASETSKLAAAAIEPVRQTVCQRVLAHMGRCSAGCTSSDVSVALNMRINSVTARLRELQLSGAIIDTGETRLCASSGHAKTVYRTTGVPHDIKRAKTRTKAAQARVDTLLELRNDLVKMNAAKHGFTTLTDFVALIDSKVRAADARTPKTKKE